MDDAAPDPLAAATALARIRALSPSLGVGDGKVAHAVLGLGQDVCYRSIGEVASAAGVAESTVVRACKRLGFTGFQDLKLAVARGAGVPARRPPEEPAGTPSEILATVLAGSTLVIEEALTTVDPGVFRRLVDLLAASGTVLIAGIGGSSPVAQDAAHRLRSIGLRVDAPVDVQAQQVAARLLTPRDMGLALSHSGATRATLDCIRDARRAGATTAAITSFDRSPLTGAVDLVLIAGGRGSPYRTDAMASRFAHLALLDALYAGVATTTGRRAATALQHGHDIARS